MIVALTDLCVSVAWLEPQNKEGEVVQVTLPVKTPSPLQNGYGAVATDVRDTRIISLGFWRWLSAYGDVGRCLHTLEIQMQSSYHEFICLNFFGLPEARSPGQRETNFQTTPGRSSRHVTRVM